MDSNSSSNSSSSYVGGNYNPSGSVEILVLLLLQWDMLVEIMYGEEATPSGFDLPGPIYYAYGQAGVSVPRSGYGQAGVGSAVSYNNMKSGDIIVWDGGSLMHRFATLVEDRWFMLLILVRVLS